MKIYIRRSDGGLASFEGMTEAAIAEMLSVQGLTYESIDEAQYNASVTAASQPKQED